MKDGSHTRRRGRQSSVRSDERVGITLLCDASTASRDSSIGLQGRLRPTSHPATASSPVQIIHRL